MLCSERSAMVTGESRLCGCDDTEMGKDRKEADVIATDSSASSALLSESCRTSRVSF